MRNLAFVLWTRTPPPLSSLLPRNARELWKLLELDSPSYGVSTPGIYIIDDDGERVCAGPFDSKSRPLPGLTPVSKTSSNTGGCKTPECLTGSPRRSSVTDQTSWNPNDPVRSRSQCVHLPPRGGLAEAGGESQGRHRAGSARAGWLRATVSSTGRVTRYRH